MKIKPERTEVIQLAIQAIEYRKEKRVALLDAVEVACGKALLPTTDEPLTINNVQEYLHLLQDAVCDEVVSQLSPPK